MFKFLLARFVNMNSGRELAKVTNLAALSINKIEYGTD